jgi:hypothetical protein
MKIIPLIFCMFVFAACSKPSTVSTRNDAKENYANSASTVFVFENETLKQTAELSAFTENEISFKLTSENKVKKQKAVIEGIAKTKGGDPEIDEDAEGNAYPSVEYTYNKGCWLAFRLDMDTKTRMRINEADCTLHNPDCPFASAGLLTKQ